MRIVEIGKCINNKDPLGLGRIRVIFLDKLNSPYERSVKGQLVEWSDNDPFVFQPFLPAHLNIVPQEQQMVKLIFWDTGNTSLNREYIAGPFNNTYDFDSQGADRQSQMTSRGVRINKEANLLDKDGNYLDAKTKGVLVNPKDVGFYGNYGTDIIFTKNGVTVRAGKLDDEKYGKSRKPVASQTPGRISIKKYDKTLEIEEKNVTLNESQHKPINTLIEYHVDNIGDSSSSYNASLYCYKVVTNDSITTNNFNQDYNIDENNLMLIYSKEFSGTLEQIGRDISIELRKIDMSETHNDLNKQFHGALTHPFYYRPTQEMISSFTTQSAVENAQVLYDNINLGITKAFGLSYSIIEKYVPTRKVDTVQKVEKTTLKPTTIGTEIADMFYTLAYEANLPHDAEKINFAKLNNYELTQEEILYEILPYTYSHVRGEPLLNLLQLIVKWMFSHVHNPVEAGISEPGLKEEILKELQIAREKILNQKTRIN